MLCKCIGNPQLVELCQVAARTAGDVCRALNAHMAPFTDGIMERLLVALTDKDLKREAKPDLLSVFGDIALAVGGGYDKDCSWRGASERLPGAR